MKKITSLIDILSAQTEKAPERVIYRFLEYKNGEWDMQNITMRALYHKSLEIAYMLRKKGLRPGDRAVIFSMQDYGTTYAILGCMMAGVTFTVIPPPLDEGKVARFISVLKSCQPKALISNYAMEQESGVSITGRLIREAFTSVIRLKRIYTDRLTPYKRKDVIVEATENRLVYLQYTSGSTSAPRGVRVTWKALMKNLEQCQACYDFNNGTLGTWVPFFHNLGLVVTICMPICTTNACAYFLSTLQFLENPKLWVKMLHDFNLTLTVGPGSAFDACTRIFTPEEAAKYPLTQVTHFMNGSEFISAETVEKFSELFHLSPNAMAPGYGLAENVCLATFASQDYRVLKLDYEAYQKNRAIVLDEVPEGTQVKEIVSVGKPVKDLTVVIGNPKTKKVYSDLHIGEIFISGDSVANGYWGNLKENANFRVKLEGYDCNFYKTGDLGFLYEGHLYITGRIKEMLIINGHNIFPSDLQALIMQKVPALATTSFGFFSTNNGNKEQVIAVVESKPEEDFQKRVSQINAAVSARFGFSFYDIIFVPRGAIPRTDNSKLQMLKARDLYQQGKLKILHSSHAYRTGSSEATIIDKSIDKADEILLQVKAVFEKVLNIEQYSLTDSFLELGGDSLMGFELVSKIEERFHVKLDLREVLLDSSVSGVANYVRRTLAGAKGASKAVDLEQECNLDASIAPTNAYTVAPQDCRNILLTGATGFLGAQLIRAILTQYPHDGLNLYCLVRADSEEAGLERLINNMIHYQCWDESYRAFLHPVIGDLSTEKFGLSEELWQELTEKIQVIYHNGALLNFVFPYEFLKETNVHGTVETLRLACAGQPKYYHYVSSYSVYDTPNNKGKRVYENDPLNTAHGFSLAYSETKWVSEKLVGIAQKRGLHTVIYRPGDITGAANGIWEMDDMVSRMIVGTIQMQAIPRTSYCMHMTPVDFVADAICCISRKPEAMDQAFNLVNPEPVPVKKAVSYIRACGYPVRYISFPAWKSKLKQADASENALTLLACLFESGTDANPGVLRHFIGKDTVYDCTKANLLLNQSGISCPPVDEKLFAAYLNYFKKNGCI